MKPSQNWKNTPHPAQHWHKISENKVKCTLCPRSCEIALDKLGFCGLRRNQENSLYTLNYGKSVPLTIETIETEAVFHYAPGENILSLGNIGCMLECDFCQNWFISQARLAQDENIGEISPEKVVDYALKHNIKILSWTYNDPVVWHEFVMDTARLAKEKGLINLYKSAFYISENAISDLLEVMDIFSISLKALDYDFYPAFTKGELEPILNGIRQVYEAQQKGANIHLEISNLCLTARNDNLKDALKVAQWMLKYLNPEIPLHYVRFHPDYLYTNVKRTDISFLEEARKQALKEGLKYVYLGNVHDTDSANTYCPNCGELIVDRYGLVANMKIKTDSCFNCGEHIPIVLPWLKSEKQKITIPKENKFITHKFREPIRSCHVEPQSDHLVYYQYEDQDNKPLGEVMKVLGKRFMISGPHKSALSVRFYYQDKAPKVYEVYSRAHFPILEAKHTLTDSPDVPPNPLEGKNLENAPK